jgi:sulfoxide reductase catalytic subunit YedY
MLIRTPARWRISESLVTDESLYRNRRAWLRMAGAGLIGAGLAGRTASGASPDASPSPVPRRNSKYILDRPVTVEEVAARHNVFDEISTERDKVWRLAGALKTKPWTVHIGGQVGKALTLDAEELTAKLGVEERL